MYLMLGTRPDLSFSLNLCSRYQDKPTDQLWKALKRILRYLKGTTDLLAFKRKATMNLQEKLIGYSDSDWAADEADRKSTSGYLFKVFNCTVTWSTRKQNTVAMSSTEAEYVEFAEASKEGIWILNMLTDFGYPKTNFTVYEDNQSCIKLTKRFEHKRLKHVDVKYNFIKDLVNDKILILNYVCTSDQVADVLTKNLSNDLLIKHRYNLGLRLNNKCLETRD